MRRIIVAAAVLLSIGLSSTVRAEPPVQDRVVVKDVVQVVTPPAECEGPAASLLLEFHLRLHGVFTSETFHFTETLNGRFTGYDAAGAEVSRGRFTSVSSEHGPGFPTLAVTNVLTATGTTVTGEHFNLLIVNHVTVTANGDVAVEVADVRCG